MSIKYFGTTRGARAFVAKKRRQGYAAQAHELDSGRIYVLYYPGGTKDKRNIITRNRTSRRNKKFKAFGIRLG